MTTLAQMIESSRHPLVSRWHSVTDAHGRTRLEMRWEPSNVESEHDTGNVTLAA